MEKRYICIDIGGTDIKYGIIDESGTIRTRRRIRTEAEKGGSGILNKVRGIISEFRKDGSEYEGVCISTAGMVDVDTGEILYSAPLIPDYAGTNLKAAVMNEFRIPCEAENDVNCAGLAEAVSGAAADSRIALMLTIGTGIGGSIIINKEVFRGFSGGAGEVGYMHMRGSSFQTLGSASAMTGKVSEWKREPQEQWDGFCIFEEAKKGDVLCNRAIDEMTEVLGQGIADICYVLNPQTVVLGGGIMAQEEFVKEKIENAVKKYLIPGICRHTTIAYAVHRNDAGMLGAFYHFRKRRNE